MALSWQHSDLEREMFVGMLGGIFRIGKMAEFPCRIRGLYMSVHA